MDIKELQNYRLSDAIKFNNRLNPRLWGSDEHLLPEVKQNLMAIADDFREFLGISNLEIKDITVSGSNAAYTYTPHSDIDLHLIVDLPKADASDVYRELFDAKKYQYNDQHNFTIGGYPVELYVQNANETHHSQGIYSLLNNEWVKVPNKRKPTVDDISVKSKYEDLGHRIEQAIASGSLERMSAMSKKIKDLRQSGLDTTGEFGPENLAFKILRNIGLLDKLRTARLAAQDQQLSLTERNKNKKKTKWGNFGGMWFPGYHNYGQSTPEIADGNTDGDVEEVKESKTNDITTIIDGFVDFCTDKLDLVKQPLIKIKRDPAWSERNSTFGKYDTDTNTLYVSVAGRHPIDVMRTIAHELAHRRQDEVESLPDDAGDTGSSWENEANAVAGMIMRDFGQLYPEYFDLGDIAEDYDPNGPPPGPESKPTMPAGTVKVDVSDVYDWYKLGQHISNLKGLGHHDFGKGPPSTIMAFGSEPEEHKYIKDLEKTGLTTTDIDPKDPNQPKGMKRQKTDPTYNVAESTGFIPVDSKLAHDPRYVSGLTVDIKPGETQRQAKKLGWTIDKDGNPPLLMKLQKQLKEFKESGLLTESYVGKLLDLTKMYQNYNSVVGQVIDDSSRKLQIKIVAADGRGNLKVGDVVRMAPNYIKRVPVLEEEDLLEIKMTSKNLRQEAAKTGAVAGMEFEMIVPNVEGDDDGGDVEPDWDQDESVVSIRDACDFFAEGDANHSGDIRRLRERMQESYWEWLNEQFDSRWESDEEEFVYSYLVENASAEEIAEILGVEPNEDGEYPEPDKQAYRNATEKVIGEGYSNYWYEQAREEAQENFNSNADEEREWLEDQDINTMMDVMNTFGMVDWPHYYPSSNGGERSIDDVANDFQDAIGRDVRASGGYHSRSVERPSPTSHHYVVEPDGSLEGDEPDDRGLEFVSPPLPIDVILNDLNKVKRWAKAYGCYTNDSTGLHINISVPNYSRENLDFVKLALLMGDEYVLDLFGRSGNTYAKSAMKLVRDEVRNKPDAAQGLLDKMKGNLDSLASKAIHSGNTSKYTSINTKDGHIEFRSPGGDWLDENFDKIENTLLRFTVAMSAALNPEMYREEYLKKLYKLLTKDEKGSYSDTIKYFTEYVAGKIPKAALRSFVKQAQLERKLKRSGTEGKKYWWSVTKPGSYASIEVVAASKDQAIEIARGEYSDWRNAQNIEAKPLRPYEEPKPKPKYEIYNKQTGNKVEDVPADITDNTAAITYLNDYQEQGPHELTSRQARDMFGVRLIGTTPVRATVGEPQPAGSVGGGQTDIENRLGWGSQSADANYEIVDRRTGQRKFLMIANTPAEAARKYADWLSASGFPEDTEDFGFRELSRPGSTTDLAQQRAVPGTFTGAWRVTIDGEEVYRFSGVGNNQMDANRVAREWAQNQISQGLLYPAGEIEVTPIMS